MAFDLTNTRTEVRALLQDQDGTNPHLADADLTTAARMALKRIALDRPGELVAEFAGTGDIYYDLDAQLTGWVDGFSSIKSIEYPAADFDDNEHPTYLDRAEDWEIVPRLDAGARNLYLYFKSEAPIAANTVRVLYTGVYTLDGLDGATDTTIPTIYEQAYYALVGAFALQQLANYMAQKGEPTLGADVTNHPDLTGRLQGNARFLLEQYAHAVGVELEGFGTGGAPGMATGRIDWDVNTMEDSDFLFHGRRGR